MYIKLSGSDTDKIIKYLEKVASFKPGSSWTIKSFSQEAQIKSRPIAQFIRTYGYIPLEKEAFLFVTVAVEAYANFNLGLLGRIQHINSNLSAYQRKLMSPSVPAINYHNGEKIILVESLFR